MIKSANNASRSNAVYFVHANVHIVKGRCGFSRWGKNVVKFQEYMVDGNGHFEYQI